MDPVPYTGNFIANVYAPGYVAATFNLTIPNSATVNQDFVLEKLGLLTGHVTASDTSPIGGASILWGKNQTFTDLTGLYTLATLIAIFRGPVEVVVSAGNRFLPQTALVTVVAGHTIESDFVLVAEAGTLSAWNR